MSINTDVDKIYSADLYRSTDKLEYIIQIGSKTRTGRLFANKGKVILEIRYQSRDEIESFDDIAYVAYGWYIDYKDGEPFTSPDSNWVKIFQEKGWIKAL